MALDNRQQPEIDRESFKTRLSTVVDQTISMGCSEREENELERRLEEACPDKTLRYELLEEINAEGTRELGKTLVECGVTMDDFRKILPRLQELDLG